MTQTVKADRVGDRHRSRQRRRAGRDRRERAAQLPDRLRLRPRGHRARRGRQPAAAAPRHPEHVGRLGRRRALPAQRHRDRRGRRPRARRRGRSRGGPRPPHVRFVDDRAADHPDGRAGVGRDRQRHRLARAEEAAQARLRLRRARRPVGLGDPVRARVPADAHQHVLGSRAVRDLRPPVDPRRRTRLRGGGQQRLAPTATTSGAPRGPTGGTTTTVRLSLVRGPRYPDPEADQGRHTSRITVRPGATIADAVEEGYRTNLPVRERPRRSGRRAADPACRTRPSWSRRSSSPRTAAATWWSGCTSRWAGAPRAN